MPKTKTAPAPATGCSVDREAFAAELRIVALALEDGDDVDEGEGEESGGTLPILTCVLLRAEAGRLFMACSDLEVSICSTVPASGAEFATCPPARKLLALVSAMRGDELNLECKPHAVQISCADCVATLSSMDAKSFPVLPSPPEGSCATIDADALARLVDLTYAISIEESRFTLNGALLEAHGGGLRMVATDGHRLALVDALAKVEGEFRRFIPKDALKALPGMLNIGGQAEYSFDENHNYFRCGSRLLISRKLSGKFPAYDRVLANAEHSNLATLSAAPFRAALERAEVFADERSGLVWLTIDESIFTVEAESVGTGSYRETVPASATGAARVAFNAQYLLDALRRIDGEVEIRLGDTSQPADFTACRICRVSLRSDAAEGTNHMSPRTRFWLWLDACLRELVLTCAVLVMIGAGLMIWGMAR